MTDIEQGLRHLSLRWSDDGTLVCDDPVWLKWVEAHPEPISGYLDFQTGVPVLRFIEPSAPPVG